MLTTQSDVRRAGLLFRSAAKKKFLKIHKQSEWIFGTFESARTSPRTANAKHQRLKHMRRAGFEPAHALSNWLFHKCPEASPFNRFGTAACVKH